MIFKEFMYCDVIRLLLNKFLINLLRISVYFDRDMTNLDFKLSIFVIIFYPLRGIL